MSWTGAKNGRPDFKSWWYGFLGDSKVILSQGFFFPETVHLRSPKLLSRPLDRLSKLFGEAGYGVGKFSKGSQACGLLSVHLHESV